MDLGTSAAMPSASPAETAGMQDWRSPWWGMGAGALGGHVQTIWPALFSTTTLGAARPLHCRRERWQTPDDDFIDVDWLVTPPHAQSPLLIVFHGLDGSSQSHYAQALAQWAAAQGWGCVVPHFRGCSGELNRAPRFYFAGDHEEIAWVLQGLRRAHPQGVRVALGVSLGGNMLLRWAQEQQTLASQSVSAIAAVSSPVDLMAAGRALSIGFNRQVYTRMFLRSMRPKALAKLRQFPGLYDEQALRRAGDLYDYDNVVTAPLHGFANSEDYWTRCSAAPRMKDITGLPTLVLNARNDPFMPAHALPSASSVSAWVTLWQPHHGGHVGFASGPWPGHIAQMPQAVGQWLAVAGGAALPAPLAPASR